MRSTSTRRRGATDQDKRAALKQLVGVVEPLRDDIGTHLLPADENALFQIANRFAIRHTSREQLRDLDGEIWLDWMFSPFYLATARALTAVLSREESLRTASRPTRPSVAGAEPAGA